MENKTTPAGLPSGDVLAGLRTPVGAVALRPVLRVPGDADLGQAARAMRSHHSSCVLVGEAGIVTEQDLASALAEERGPETPVASIATRTPKVVAAETPLGRAAALMVRYGVRHLPVVAADGEILGLLEIESPFRVLLRETGQLVWLAELDGVVADGG